jgi:hypothetical protein
MSKQKSIAAQAEQISRYEAGEMSDEETIEFFQDLIDSGLVWQLQGVYGRQAMTLINAGYCHAPRFTGEA